MPTSDTTTPDGDPRARWRRRRGKPFGVRVLAALAALVAGAGVCAAAVATLMDEPEAGAATALTGMSAPGPARPVQPVAPQAAQPAAQALALAAAEAKPAGRRVYPYSIVPGGVYSKDELVQAIQADKVVADHYADFKVDQARMLKVAKPRAVYVSYRKGDKVYWTSKKLTLAVGESLISDGVNEARARCANRISDTPRQPVEVKGPTEEELDSSVMQVSSEGQADEGTPYVHQLQTFGSDGDAAPGQTASMSGTELSLDNLGGTRDSGTSYTTLGTSSTGSSGRPETESGGDETPGGSSGGGTPGGDASTPKPAGDPESGNPDGGGPPTGGQQQPDDDPPPVETPDPVPELTPLIPEPGEPPLPENPDESATGPAELPEPGTLWLGAGAFAALLLVRRRR